MRIIVCRVLLIAVLTSDACVLMAQTAFGVLDFEKITAHEGLSNSHVNAIGQDKNGFIWIATNDGLNRFDGTHIETFHHHYGDSSSISSNTVFAVFTDRQQRIWFGTFSGLCMYDYGKGEFVRYILPPQPDIIKYVPVWGIAQTKNDDFWLATSGGGLAHMSARTQEVTYFRHDADNPSTSIVSDYLHSIALDDDENVWLGSENDGLSIFDPRTGTCRNINKSTGHIGSDIVTSLYKSRDGRVWIGTYEGGVSVYDPKTDSFVLHRLVGDGASVYGIAEDGDGNLWIGTQESGIFLYDGHTFRQYSNAIGNTRNLIGDNIRVVFTDKDGVLWLGCFQGGVNMLKPRPMFGGIGYAGGDSEIGISHKPVLSICTVDRQTVYLGTDGDGINIWNPLNNHVQHIRAGEQGLKSNIIRSMFMDRSGRMWVGTFMKGLLEYDPVKKSFAGFENIPGDSASLSTNDVTSILEDNGGNLWVGTNGGGLNMLDKKSGRFKWYKRTKDDSTSLINDYVTSLYIDRDDYMWICTFWGLSRMRLKDRVIQNFPLTDRHNTYFCFFEDSKGRHWAGSTDGLRLIDFESGTFKSVTTADGLPNNIINGITEDEYGSLWVSTNRGICKFNYDSMSFNNFFAGDGLFSNEFMHNSLATGPDGMVYFGSIEGVTRFYPGKICIETAPPRVMFSDLLVFNKKVTPGDGSGILKKSMAETDDIQLQWQDNSFTIVYKAIEYVQPKKVRYASRMRGFDSQWQYYDYTQTSASYTNLDAGVYYYEVMASTDGITWSEPDVLKVRIIAPAWRRWWAIALYILIAMLAIHFGWRRYRRTEQEKQQAKLQYIKQQNDIELNKTRLQFFTNISHEIRTPLTLLISPLQQMAESGKYDAETQTNLALMQRNAQRLLRIVNQVMDIRKIDNGKLQFSPVKGDLVSFTREVCENFQQLAACNNISLTFRSELKDFVAYFDPEIIDKALCNLLSNALKFTSPDGRVSVEVCCAELPQGKNGVSIVVDDNGRGIAPENIDKIFDRYFQGDSSAMQQGTGIGLWLTKEYVELHQGFISVSSQVGRGTTFIMTLTDGEAFKDVTKDAASYRHQSVGAFLDIDSPVQVAQDGAPPHTDAAQAEASTSLKYTLLVVEDNADIRRYLRDSLSKKYNVKTARDGIDGLEIARTTLPDLVITDIAMPGMTGIELCRTLKSDLDTCHIPVIMLTAKSSETQRIEGLETGADSYITKPFNPRHLNVRIEKLLELRMTLREKFSSEVGFKAVQTAVTTTDRDLLKRVSETIQKRISDTSLSVETLAEEVGLSRGHLQRKLKSLTGQNPNEFIRIIRLKYAAELLIKRQDLSIAEVAENAGFNSQSYFSTAFTRQFSISPSQYKDEADA